MTLSLKKCFSTLLIIAIIIFFDQSTKLYLMHKVFNTQPIVNLLPFLDFVPVYNRGVSFGLFNTLGPFILIAVTVLLISILCFLLFTEKVKMYKLAYTMIIGGALGNLIDRIYMGAVFDFIYVNYQGYAFPAFNIADSMITLGAGIYILGLLKKHD